jgi:mxaA protein
MSPGPKHAISCRIHCRQGTVLPRFPVPFIGLLSMLAILTLPACTSDSSPVKKLSLYAPRSFGYVIGDKIQHSISMTVARPYELEKGFLPKPGPLNDWLELAGIDWKEEGSLTERRYELLVTYQIFKNVEAPQTLTIPALTMRAHDGDNSIGISTQAWSFSFAPLVSSAAQSGSNPIRPPQAPLRLPLQPHLWMLAAMTAGFLLIAFYCAWRYDLLPFLQRRPRPFTRGCRALKKLQGGSDTQSYRTALRIMHKALNETAGETLFLDRLNRFYEQHPAMADLCQETEAFFTVSRKIFFGRTDESVQQEFPLERIDHLCRRYREKENSLRR